MTKKHFIALADAIRAHNRGVPDTAEEFGEAHIEALADFCEAQNPRFQRGLWLAYVAGECGPNGGKVRREARVKNA